MENRKLWCVRVAYHYGYEAAKNQLDTDVRLFTSEKAAVDELESIIRQDWTTEVETEDGTKLLADCRGMADVEGSKYSDWCYSEDGKVAWAFFSDDHGYKGEVSEIEVCE